MSTWCGMIAFRNFSSLVSRNITLSPMLLTNRIMSVDFLHGGKYTFTFFVVKFVKTYSIVGTKSLSADIRIIKSVLLKAQSPMIWTEIFTSVLFSSWMVKRFRHVEPHLIFF